jgi:hypothetical protein
MRSPSGKARAVPARPARPRPHTGLRTLSALAVLAAVIALLVVVSLILGHAHTLIGSGYGSGKGRGGGDVHMLKNFKAKAIAQSKEASLEANESGPIPHPIPNTIPNPIPIPISAPIPVYHSGQYNHADLLRLRRQGEVPARPVRPDSGPAEEGASWRGGKGGGFKGEKVTRDATTAVAPVAAAAAAAVRAAAAAATGGGTQDPLCPPAESPPHKGIKGRKPAELLAAVQCYLSRHFSTTGKYVSYSTVHGEDEEEEELRTNGTVFVYDRGQEEYNTTSCYIAATSLKYNPSCYGVVSPRHLRQALLLGVQRSGTHVIVGALKDLGRYTTVVVQL